MRYRRGAVPDDGPQRLVGCGWNGGPPQSHAHLHHVLVLARLPGLLSHRALPVGGLISAQTLARVPDAVAPELVLRRIGWVHGRRNVPSRPAGAAPDMRPIERGGKSNSARCVRRARADRSPPRLPGDLPNDVANGTRSPPASRRDACAGLSERC